MQFKPTSKRTLKLETLESREMLSVVPLSASEYADLREQYADFGLPEIMEDQNVITLDLAQGDGLAQLKDAITSAGETEQADLIVVRTSDEYNTVTYTTNTDELLIDIDSTQFGSISIVGIGSNSFTLDANRQCRVMSISGDSAVVNLGGLTITNGESTNSLANTTFGGGIYNPSGTLTVMNSTISANSVTVNTSSGSSNSYGGGIYNQSGTLTIVNSTFSGNSVTLNSSYTSSTSSLYSYGGGIYNQRGALTVTNSAFLENSVYVSGVFPWIRAFGGGIYNQYGQFTVTNSTFLKNSASGSGGGIYNQLGTLTVIDSLFSENMACGKALPNYSPFYGGGGIYNVYGSSTVINSIISGNFSAGRGGGIFCDNSTSINIFSCTIAGNSADYGGGLYVGSCYLVNSIVSLNQSVNEGQNIYGRIPYTSHNNLIDGDYTTFVCIPVFNSEGKLANADTLDLHLRSDSQAIDAGEDSDVSDIAKDMDGNDRIYGDSVDIGAYEYQGGRNDQPVSYSSVVDTLNDSFDAEDGEWSLREAIYYASDYTTITFAENLNGTIKLAYGQLLVDKALVIDGNGRITLDADQKSRVLCVLGGTTETPVVLNGLTIQNGRTNSHGGGIFNAGSLEILNCNISRNTIWGDIYNSGYLMGGGIYNSAGTLSLTNSVISGNTIGSSFNSSNGEGAGIYNSNTRLDISTGITSYLNNVITVTNCTISGNSSCGRYGGLYGSFILTNSIVSLNYAKSGTKNIGSLSSASQNNLIGYNPFFVNAPVFDKNGNLTNWETMDLHLRSNSRAIDAGDNSSASEIATDLGGLTRIYGDSVDIGAYEYQGDGNDEFRYSTVVNTLNDSFDFNDDEWSLREAIYYAPEYVTITFADDLEGTIVLTQGSLVVDVPLAIDGDNRITIDADQKSRVFTVSSGTKTNPVVLNGLTIQNGQTGSGGGIYNSGTLMVTNSTISGNTASGGGIYNSGTLTVINSMISGNTASNESYYYSYGGGIYNSGTLTVINSMISGNTASSESYYSYGGGIYTRGILTVINSTISGNAAYAGGGIYNDSGTLTVTNNTISGNTAPSSYGSGIYTRGTSTINNSIVVDSIYGGNISGSNNLTAFTDWTEGSNNLIYDSTRPLFVDAENGDYHLAVGSQAINKGENALAVDENGEVLTCDLEGNARIANEIVDIGAYEYTLIVDYQTIREKYSIFDLPESESDINIITVDLTVGEDLTDLKEAIVAAGQTTQADLIVVHTSDEANTLTYSSSADELIIDIDATQYGSLTIVGLGPQNFTLDANQKCRVMTVSGETTVANLGSLTIKNGQSVNSSTYNARGGGIYNYYGILTVNGSTISGNSASYGGGIINYFGTTTVANSSLLENSSSYGGGGLNNHNGTLSITNCIVSQNSSNEGGGIRNYASGTLTVTNCIFSENTAVSHNGDGIYSSGSVSTVNNSIIVDSISNSGTISGSNNLSTFTNWTNGSNNLIYDSAKPLFVDAENGDYHLIKGSQAIDKGNNALAVDANGAALVYDMEGKSRIVNGTVDLGAYESLIELSSPELAAPTVNDQTITFSWSSVPNVSGYQFEYKLSTDSDWTAQTVSGTSLTLACAVGDVYYIRVKALGTGDYSDSSYSAPVTIPVAYNEAECAQIRAFLEQTDENGVKNGTKINADYSSADLTTWNEVVWTEMNGEMRVTKIDWTRKNFAGICDFSALTELTYLSVAGSVNGNTVYGRITSIDVSTCTKLYYFDCSRNRLTSLDISNNTQLTTLWCNENPLGTLDLTHNTLLKNLSCSKNELSSVVVSQCADLSYFLCSGNQLTSLDVSNNLKLEKLQCDTNKLTSLNLSNHVLLGQVNCNDNQLTSLNVSGCTNLKTIWGQRNKLSSLDVSDCAALTVFVCYTNSLTSLDVTSNPNLKFFDCGSNKITSVDVTQNLKLEFLSVSYNKMADLNLSANTNLWGLTCRKCELTELNVRNNTKLKHLDCSSNQLVELDVSQNVELSGPDGTTTVSFDGSGVAFAQPLYGLKCYDNSLTALDLSFNTKLTLLECLDSPNLQTITISPICEGKLVVMRSGYDSTTWNVYDNENSLIGTIDSGNQVCVLPEAPITLAKADGTQTVQIVAIEAQYHEGDVSALRTFLEKTDSSGVKNGKKINSNYDPDDPATWTGVTWKKIEGVKRVTVINWTSKGLVGVLDLEGCDQLLDLNTEGNTGITKVDVSDCTELTTLRVWYLSSELDLSQNLKLTTLSCRYCTFSNLDVRNNVLLERLWCPQNNLTELDLSNNVNLNTLCCMDNQFTSLDLSNNVNLANLYCLNFDDSPLTRVFLNQDITSLLIGSYWGGTWSFKDYCDNQLSTASSYTTDTIPLIAVSPSGNQTVQFCYKIQDPEKIYNDEVYAIQAFLEQTNGGIKNGKRLNSNYSPDDPSTWKGITWTEIDNELRVTQINWQNKSLAGSLGLSKCTRLAYVNVEYNRISQLRLPGGDVLKTVLCHSNTLNSLDVTNCTGLQILHCGQNSISSLDLSRNAQLTELHCSVNPLTELDVLHNPALVTLSCYSSSLSSVLINSQSIDKISISLQASGESWTWKDWDGNTLATGQNFQLSQIPVCAVSSRQKQEIMVTLTDVEVLRAFLEIEDENGIKNGEKLNPAYSAEDASTWTGVTWETVANTQRITRIDWKDKNLTGALDVSSYTHLKFLDLRGNSISSLKCSKNTALEEVKYTSFRNDFLPLYISGGTVKTDPVHGSIMTENGKMEYRPNSSFMGTDSFVWGSNSSEKSFTVSVEVPNRVSVAVDDSFTYNGQIFLILDVLANDSDPDDDALSTISVSQPTHGQASVFADGKIFYAPAGNVTSDSFTYTISDGFGGTSAATVTITALENAQPAALNDSARIELNGNVLIDVLANDSDPDGDALTILSVMQPTNGTAVITKDDKILYLPKTGFAGTDSFTYMVSDGRGGTAAATVSVEVIRTLRPLIVTPEETSPGLISEWDTFSVELHNAEGLAETQTVCLAWDSSLFELNTAQAAGENGVTLVFGEAVTENGITTQNVVLNVENAALLDENALLASLEFLPAAADSITAGDSADWTISVNREALNVEVESFVYDLDDSGTVEINDLVAFARLFGNASTVDEQSRIADFDGKGTVDIQDLVLFARNFGKKRPAKPVAATAAEAPAYASEVKLEEMPAAARGNVNDAAMAAYFDEMD